MAAIRQTLSSGCSSLRDWTFIFLLLFASSFVGGIVAGLIMNRTPKAASSGSSSLSRQVRGPEKFRRVPRFVAGGVVLDELELQRLGSDANAAFSASRIMDEFRATERKLHPSLPARNFDEYLLGWMAVIQNAKPYSTKQLALGISQRLCNGDSSRIEAFRSVIRKASPEVADDLCR